MKYVGNTTQSFSIEETIQELSDVVGIAESILKSPNANIKTALINLEQAEHYLEYIRKKVKLVLKYVPEDMQQKEYL